MAKTNGLNGFNLKSYETIRFVTKVNGRKGNYSINPEKTFFRWITHNEMWDFVKDTIDEFLVTSELEEDKYYLYMLALTIYIYKKRALTMKKSKYRKIKKLSRQNKEQVFDFLIFEDEKCSVSQGEWKSLVSYIQELLVNAQKSSQIKRYMSSKLTHELELQTVIFKRYGSK